MDLAFTPEDLAFQREVRDWIAQEYDDELRAYMAQSKNGYMPKPQLQRWMKKLAAKGWLTVDWPVEYGGCGWSSTQRYIFGMEMAAAKVPPTLPFGVRMVAPVIMAFASEAQKAQHLPPIANADLWWCQGYSEPGSGSDLAALQMRADREGDDYVLNGSKIWTTLAQHADWIFCLVRTSQEKKRQNGISFLLVDMKTPGITVRPLPTLDGPMPNEQEINQVFFEDVRVPVANRIGEEGKGWTYAKYLLEFERGNAYAPGLNAALAKVRKLAAVEQDDRGAPLITDPDFRRKLAEAQIKVDALDATELRVFAGRSNGESVGAASSMLKCEGSEMQQHISALMLEAVGEYAVPFVQDTFAELRGGPASNVARAGPDYAAVAAPAYFSYRKTSIYAGSNEVQHNIMAKLVLGL